MEYSTLNKILDYIIENKIKLTPIERKFLLNIAPDERGCDDVILERFIKWCNSPIRKDNITKVLATQKISTSELTNLLALSSEEIESVLERYQGESSYYLGYLTLCFARFKAYENKKRKDTGKMFPENYCFEVLDIIAGHIFSSSLSKVEKYIGSDELYTRKDLIKQFVYCKNMAAQRYVKIVIGRNCPDSDIAAHYIKLALESESNEQLYKGRIPDNKLINKVSKRARAKEAVLRQNSLDKMNEVMYAAANNGIYRKRNIFNIIQRQNTIERMKNLRCLAQINRLRNYPEFFEWYDSLDVKAQRRLLDKILENERMKYSNQREEEETKIKSIKDNAREQLDTFTKGRGIQSIKKLQKTLKDSIDKHPYLRNEDTAERD